jgi:DNA-binding MurR/RpiR family transcriptional regulator
MIEALCHGKENIMGVSASRMVKNTMAKSANDVSPLVKIKSCMDSLRPSERKVALFVQNNPNEIIYLNIVSMAEKCGVSEASVIRLCKALGYSGYQELKINLAKSIVDPVKSIQEEISESDDVGAIIEKVTDASIQAIKDTMQILDPVQVERAIDTLSAARRVEFYGMGGSAVVAADAQHKFFKYGFFCINYSDPHMQAMSAATMTSDDVVVGISHSGSSKDLINSLTIASESGATVICVTSSANSPIVRISDINLIVIAKEQQYKTEPMTSRIAQLSVIDILSVGVALRHQDRVLANLQKTRAALTNWKY